MKIKQCQIKRMYSKYPMKLICPTLSFCPSSKTLYVLNYGGGLVQGDKTLLKIKINLGANLTILTQGNTKVFKSEARLRTYQTLIVTINEDSSLILLSDSVMCFRKSTYIQKQFFNLSSNKYIIIIIIQ